jgi:hypothetical protein
VVGCVKKENISIPYAIVPHFFPRTDLSLIQVQKRKKKEVSPL